MPDLEARFLFAHCHSAASNRRLSTMMQIFPTCLAYNISLLRLTSVAAGLRVKEALPFLLFVAHSNDSLISLTYVAVGCRGAFEVARHQLPIHSVDTGGIFIFQWFARQAAVRGAHLNKT